MAFERKSHCYIASHVHLSPESSEKVLGLCLYKHFVVVIFECYSLQEFSLLPGWHLKERVIASRAGPNNPPSIQGLISFEVNLSQFSL